MKLEDRNGDGCSATCKIEPTHECTIVSQEKSVCTPICGDGFTMPFEDCDDNNTVSDDGCSD